jgi:hypothetical protein
MGLDRIEMHSMWRDLVAKKLHREGVEAAHCISCSGMRWELTGRIKRAEQRLRLYRFWFHRRVVGTVRHRISPLPQTGHGATRVGWLREEVEREVRWEKVAVSMRVGGQSRWDGQPFEAKK